MFWGFPGNTVSRAPRSKEMKGSCLQTRSVHDIPNSGTTVGKNFCIKLAAFPVATAVGELVKPMSTITTLSCTHHTHQQIIARLHIVLSATMEMAQFFVGVDFGSR